MPSRCSAPFVKSAISAMVSSIPLLHVVIKGTTVFTEKLFELKNWNYVSDEIKDSINNKEISDNYIVRIYVSGEGKNIYTNTCIYENKMVNNVQRSVCIADETGKYDFDDNSIVGVACCKEGA